MRTPTEEQTPPHVRLSRRHPVIDWDELDPDPLAGTPYRAISRLGEGGMGEVFEARHRRLGSLVVVKLLREAYSKNAQLVDRLRLEAQALARLGPHPNLVAVSDLGETPDARPYLVMERLKGRTLLQEIYDVGAIPLAEAVDYVRQALAGLGAAHRAGLVHRDLKLDNIFLCDAPDGLPRIVKVLDFGIAKVVDEHCAAAPKPLMIPTDEDLSVGTPRFFSPEQARGQAVDARSDVYTMGVVLYTLVTGRGPFDHLDDALELARAHVLETPERPSIIAPQPVPAALDRAIMRAMAKQREKRFSSADAFSAELERIVATLPELWLSAGSTLDSAEPPMDSVPLAELRSTIVAPRIHPPPTQPAVPRPNRPPPTPAPAPRLAPLPAVIPAPPPSADDVMTTVFVRSPKRDEAAEFVVDSSSNRVVPSVVAVTALLIVALAALVSFAMTR